MGIRCCCPNGHKLNVKAERAGKIGICPVCGLRFQIPFGNAQTPTSHESANPVSPQIAGEQHLAKKLPPNPQKSTISQTAHVHSYERNRVKGSSVISKTAIQQKGTQAKEPPKNVVLNERISPLLVCSQKEGSTGREASAVTSQKTTKAKLSQNIGEQNTSDKLVKPGRSLFDEMDYRRDQYFGKNKPLPMCAYYWMMGYYLLVMGIMEYFLWVVGAFLISAGLAGAILICIIVILLLSAVPICIYSILRIIWYKITMPNFKIDTRVMWFVYIVFIASAFCVAIICGVVWKFFNY